MSTALQTITTAPVGYARIDSPVGDLLIAASEQGVHRVVLNHEDQEQVLDDLGRLISANLIDESLDATSALTLPLRTQIDEYFAGTRFEFDVETDLSLVHGFQRQVIEALALIPYGSRWSYGTVAEAVGRPRAHRAVGTACGANPLPLIYPCHRVIRSDGSIGFYGGGEAMKAALLDHERTIASAR